MGHYLSDMQCDYCGGYPGHTRWCSPTAIREALAAHDDIAEIVRHARHCIAMRLADLSEEAIRELERRFPKRVWRYHSPQPVNELPDDSIGNERKFRKV